MENSIKHKGEFIEKFKRLFEGKIIHLLGEENTSVKLVNPKEVIDVLYFSSEIIFVKIETERGNIVDVNPSNIKMLEKEEVYLSDHEGDVR